MVQASPICLGSMWDSSSSEYLNVWSPGSSAQIETLQDMPTRSQVLSGTIDALQFLKAMWLFSAH